MQDRCSWASWFVARPFTYGFWRNAARRRESLDAASEAQRIIDEARTKSELTVKEAELKAKDMLVGARADAEHEQRERRRELAAFETKLQTREETFEKRLEAYERREADLNRRDQNLRNRDKTLTEKEAEQQGLIDEARARA